MVKALILTVGIACLFVPQANANLLLNGSFETPDVLPGALGPIGGWETFYEPTPGLGWIPIAGGMEILDHVVGTRIDGVDIAWDAYKGDQFAELDTMPADPNGGMYQNVDTDSGRHYTLHFVYSPRPGVLPNSNIIYLYLDGLLVDTLTGSGVGELVPVWSHYNYQFVASGTSTEIKFLAGGIDDGLGGFLDDVRLTPVQEPSTLLLLGSGMIGLVGCRKKHRGD